MTILERRETDGSSSLEELETIVQQMEGILGPLLTLGCQDGTNFLYFEVTTRLEPERRARLVQYDEAPNVPAGFVLVCAGACQVKDKRVRVAASRKA